VLVSLGVSITFVPACMRIFCRTLFWPGLTETRRREPLLTRLGAFARRQVASGTSRRLVAWPTVLIVGAALVAGAAGIGRTRLALTPIRGLQDSTPPTRAAANAERGFTGGIIAPTELVLQAPGIARNRDGLRRFSAALRRQPSVGAVIGPGMAPLPEQEALVFATRSGGAVRYFVAFRHHPYSSAAIDDLGSLQGRVPGLLQAAGLGGASVLFAGDTALAKETTKRVHHDLLWVGLAAAAVNLVLLALFLRSLLAPLLLVGASALAIAATFGLTTYVFGDLFHTADLTYFVPLAVGVLLLSFGTDYNLFVVGRIWQEAETQTMPEAIRTAVPRASRAISVAGIALACSFAMLAIVPIAPFREFAVAIGIGVVIDTLVVRTLLIPALLAAAGDRARWPSRSRIQSRASDEEGPSRGGGT
jgi:RND superfamily putative drug exporter